ncbi:MAG: glycoside hydrolase family 3 protein [Clostridia bacterium]
MKKVSVALILIITVFATVFKLYTIEDNFEDIQIQPTEEISVSVVPEIMENMTLDEMVYQMMFVTPEALTNEKTHTCATEIMKKSLEKHPVGGIIYFAKNFKDREQTIEMISKTKEYSQIPLFIGVDEEGGRVSRLGKNENMGVVHLPPMSEIKDKDEAYHSAAKLAADLKGLGFNLDFAPVADVIINEKNSEIGDRSFGSDPTEVGEKVFSFVKGMGDGSIISALKHFPGHGSTAENSHNGYSESTRSYDRLKKCEFLPFEKGIQAGAEFVMVSHMTLINATEEKVPSSLSKEVITGFLKGDLGFKGIVITDSLSMGAITENYLVEDSAVKAVLAGADMLLMPKDLEKAHDAIVNAVEDGTIGKKKIEESVRKILEVKERNGILD